MAHEAVIGLECHIQLATRSKMFCECPAEFGASPNSNVCPVCLGLPGALPVVNRAAIDAALQLGLVLGCTIREASVFARKNYFYPDMPKNYQITQYDRPLCEGGALPVRLGETARSLPLIRIHVEEDTGKSFHPERTGDRPVSRVDFNRAGVPLLELVTEPAFRQPEECGAFLAGLRRLARWLKISDGDMEKGHLRCDANVSLRPPGSASLGTKTEIKNLNSIKGVEKGLAAEIARQAAVLDAGGRIEQATLLYDADHDKLAVMRSKEYAHDYRYFPEPDLPQLTVDAAWVEEVRGRLPEPPWTREDRYVDHLGLPAYDAAILCETRERSDYFEAVVGAGTDAKRASNWVMTEVLRHVNARGLSEREAVLRLPAKSLAALIGATESGRITSASAKEVLEEVFEKGGDPEAVIAARGLVARSSPEELLPLVREVLAENPGPVAQFRGGKQATLGFLVGQVMKKSGGRAAPQVVQELLRAELGALR